LLDSLLQETLFCASEGMTVKVLKQLPSSERPPIRGNNEDGKGRGKYRDNRERDQEHGGEVVNNRIYVGGLGYNIDERDLYHFFNNFGPVQHVGIITKDGYTKGYGFVTFYCSEVVTRLLASPERENLILKGRKLNIGAARQHSQTYWGRRQGQGIQAPLNHHRGQVQEEESIEKVKEETELSQSVGSQFQPSYPATSNDANATVPSTATAIPPYYQETGPYTAYYPQQTVPVAYPYYYPYTQHIDPTLQEYYYPTYSYYQDSSYSYQDQAVPSGPVAPLPFPLQHQASLYTAMNYQGQPTIMQTPYFVNPSTEEMAPAPIQGSQDNSQGFYEAPPVGYYLPPGNGGDAHAYPDVIQAVAAQPDAGQAVHNPEVSVLGDSGFQDAVENSFQGRGGQQLDPQQQGGPVMDGQYRSNPNGGKVFKEPVKVAKTGQGPNQGKVSLNNFNSDSNARSFNKPRSFGESRPSPDQNPGPHNRDSGRGSRTNPLSYRTFSPFQGNHPRQFPFPPRNPRPQYQQQRGGGGRGRVWGYGHSGSGQGGNVRWSIGKKKPGKKGTGNDGMKGPKVEEKSSGCLASNQPDILQGPLEKLEIK